jgi:hypothetical protein
MDQCGRHPHKTNANLVKPELHKEPDDVEGRVKCRKKAETPGKIFPGTPCCLKAPWK